MNIDRAVRYHRLKRRAGVGATLLSAVMLVALLLTGGSIWLRNLAAAGTIASPDTQSTPAAIAALKAAGIRVVMLTGDNATTARAVAHKLGLTDVEAEVLPEDKGKVVARLRAEGGVVAMAGDGVNDAPALAAADVGIAMGTGTDVAMESAGITLLKGDLNGIVRARHLSAATMANIRQNLFFAFIYNAAGVLQPFHHADIVEMMRRGAELPRKWRDTSETMAHAPPSPDSAASVLSTKGPFVSNGPLVLGVDLAVIPTY